jgi:hypothetical protein
MVNTLFRSDDIKAVEGKIDEIMDISAKKALDILIPTIKEYTAVNNLVISYIKKNQRIVYGGIAIHELLKEKSPKDVFYKENTKNDIEIYSPDPVGDVFNLCNMLHKNKFEFVEGKEADHPGTFTIFVNFDKYCDITYVPKLVYHNLPFLKVNGFKIIHPSIILTDTLRVYTDPLTSYYRLKKTFERTNLLLKVAKFEPKPGVIKEDDKYNYIISKFVPKISEISSSIILVDDIAYNYYLEEANNKKLKESHVGIIVQNFNKNAQKIYDVLLDIIAEKDNNFRDNINVEEYNIFFQFWYRRIEIYYNKKKIVTIYENKDKCYPYRSIEKYGKNINIGSFSLVFLYYLITYQYNIIFKKQYSEYENRLGNLLEAKNKYLSEHKLTVIDKSPFQEFQIECLGETIDFKRKTRLKYDERRKKNYTMVYRFQPDEDRNSLTTEYKFPNEAGTIITNDKNKTIR